MKVLLYIFGRLFFKVYLNVFYRPYVSGIENVPGRKPFIICSNHVHLMDPMMIAIFVPAHYRIHYMAKNEVFRNAVFSFLLKKVGAFPVNRKEADYAAIKKAFQLLNDGQIIGLFPEGSRSRSGCLQRAYHGAALIAVRSGTPILPAAIVGPYRLFKPVRMSFGPPFILPPLVYNTKEEKKEKLEEMSFIIMDNIRRLILEEKAV